ncbi:hypothetical protein G3A39_40990 [Paraburkholderia aspalathi]|nr:hypothetical protein [Paraburkholderia aspalathi]
MALSDYNILTQDIALPGGNSFPVRGLSLIDVTSLFRSRGPEIQAYFAKYMGDKPTGKGAKATDLASKLSGELGIQLLDAAPMLAAEIISCAADEPSMAYTASRLPITIQLEALEAIATMTFDAAGGPKKFMEAVMRVLQGTTSFMGDLNQSTIGLLASEGK